MVNGTKTDAESLEDIQKSIATTWIVSNSAIMIIFCIGAPANIYMLYRLRKLAKENQDRFEIGAGLALCAMTSCDIISMLASLLRRTLEYYAPLLNWHSIEVLEQIACKVKDTCTLVCIIVKHYLDASKDRRQSLGIAIAPRICLQK